MSTTVSRRKEVRRWLKERIGEADSVVLPDLVSEATNVFKHDEEFIVALVEEELRPLIYQMAQKLLADTRHDGVIEFGDELVTKGEFDKRATVRFENWMEHAGDRHIRFMRMDRRDLILARRENADRAEPFLRRVALIDRVLPCLSRNETVEEVFSPEEVEDMYKRIAKEREEERESKAGEDGKEGTAA